MNDPKDVTEHEKRNNWNSLGGFKMNKAIYKWYKFNFEELSDF